MTGISLILPSNADNRIVNPCMDIDQANEAASVAVATTTTQKIGDQWQVAFTGVATGITAQKVSTGGGGDFNNSLKVTIGTGSATINAGDFLIIKQNLMGLNVADLAYGGGAAQPISLSFWVNSSIAGTFGYYLSNSATNRSYVGTFTITTAQVAVLTRIQINAIPGDITGTWLTTNGIGLTFGIVLECGSTFQTTAGAWGAGQFFSTSGQTNLPTTSANTFQLTGVKLAPELLATPLIRRPYEQEIYICRSFYQKTFPDGTAPAQNAGVTGAITVKNPIALGDPSEWLQFIPKMRATPTITTYNPSATNANWRDITAAADATVSVDPSTTIGQSGVLIATTGTVTTLGDVLAIHVVADARL